MSENPIDKKANAIGKTISTSITVWRFLKLLAYCGVLFGLYCIGAAIVIEFFLPEIGAKNMGLLAFIGASISLIGLIIVRAINRKINRLKTPLVGS